MGEVCGGGMSLTPGKRDKKKPGKKLPFKNMSLNNLLPPTKVYFLLQFLPPPDSL